MRILDLFCGAGGAAIGLRQALDAARIRAEIVGVDIQPRPHYPFAFVRGDALEYAPHAKEFDFVWASPPCQRYSVATPNARREEHPDLVAPTRDMLLAAGRPFVIENVPGAPLTNAVLLCGSMFAADEAILWEYVQCTPADDAEEDGLLKRMFDSWREKRMHVRRHRRFEPHGFTMRQKQCEHALTAPAIAVTGYAARRWTDKHRKAHHLWMAKAALGVPPQYEMTYREAAQCIPPAFGCYVMEEFLRGKQ